MSETKKQNFLQGTAMLAGATAIVKLIGALYKIPLNAIIGEQGYSYFNTAYDIYTVLLMISTAGLPVAMSRMISEANALGNYRQVRKIYTTARNIFLALGLAGGLLMTVFCRQLAQFQEQPDAWLAIGLLGPSAFFICLMSAYRGFFQGQGNMMPTSVSQVLEAAVKLTVGIVAALALLKLTDGSVPHAAGGAILGVTMSCLVSTVYLGGLFRKAYDRLPKSCEETEPSGVIARRLLAIAVPITIGSAGLSILTMMETKIYMSRLLETMTQDQADLQKGIYNMCQTIFNMPCAFIPAITISIIPAITAQLTLKNPRGARRIEESATRVTGLIAAPCAVGLAVLAQPVTALLGGYTGEKLELSTPLMAILGVCVIFNAVVLVTNAMMQAHGQVNLPVINMFIGGLLKLVLISILAGNPKIGILGAPIGSLMCYVCISVLNLFSIRKVFRRPPAVLRNLLRSVLAALIMGAAAYGSWRGIVALFHGSPNRIIACAVPILVGVAVYVPAVVWLKAITREDCLLLPKGEKIANLLHLS